MRRGDADAFTRLFDRYAAAVFRYAATVLGNRQYAEDVVQETFLTMWSQRKAFEIYGDSVLPWLLVTARNHSRNLGRLLLRQASAQLDETDRPGNQAELAEVVAQRAALEAIAEAVGRLSTTDQSLVALCIMGGERYVEAAASTGLTPAATARRVQRIRSRLRKIGGFGERQ